jgi:hypothetical protein
VSKGDLAKDDINDLVEMCKSEHGLAEQQDAVPLSQEHVPDVGSSVTVSASAICQ